MLGIRPIADVPMASLPDAGAPPAFVIAWLAAQNAIVSSGAPTP